VFLPLLVAAPAVATGRGVAGEDVQRLQAQVPIESRPVPACVRVPRPELGYATQLAGNFGTTSLTPDTMSPWAPSANAVAAASALATACAITGLPVASSFR